MHKTFKDGLHGAGSERTVWGCVGGVVNSVSLFTRGRVGESILSVGLFHNGD